jgi:tetratricopeptide (TPR) repeat protein
MIAVWRRLPVLMLAVVLGAACGDAARRGGALQVPPLPDLAKLAPSVQTQVRDRFARVTTLASAGAPDVEQSQASGDVGLLLMAAQFPDAPAAFLARAEALAPADYRWPYYLAQFHRQRGEPEPARAAFERALARNPSDVAALVWLGETLLQLGQPDAAKPRFDAALALQPTSISARFGLGRVALAANDAGAAVDHFEAVLARDATAAAVHYPLSQAYAALGDTAKADLHLRQRANHQILPADPLMVALDTLLESPQSYETRGIRALEAKEWVAAADWFRRGLALAPGNAALHHRLGAALNMTGDRGAARAAFLEAVRLSPEQFLALYSLGVLDQEDGRHADAVGRFTAAIAIRPTYVEARLRLASSLRRTARAADALAEYRRVLADDAGQSEARIGEVMTLAQLGRHREARAALERAHEAAPESIAFAHGLARLLVTAADARVRDGQRAKMLVDDLVQQGRTLDLGETMAMTLAELGEFERAAAVQRDLLTAAQRAGLPAVVNRIAANLARYEARTPCRTPWTEQEWP